MSQPSANMKAVLVLAQHKTLGPILKPALDVENDSIKWERLHYGGQSGGVQIALSWAYCLFCDEPPPVNWNYRNPFELGNLDRDMVVLIFQALSVRHDFISLSVEDKPKSDFQKMVEGFGDQMVKDEKRKNLKVVPNDGKE